jgi:hypothetical protein
LEVGFAVVQMKAEGKFPSVIFFRFQCGDTLSCFHALIGSGANLSVNFSLRLCAFALNLLPGRVGRLQHRLEPGPG